MTRPRVAIVVASQPVETNSRAAVARSDSEALSRRLRDLGFEVRFVGPTSRPELARTLRDAATQIQAGADVAIIALGQSLGGRDDIFLLPAGAVPDLATRPDLLETQAYRLGDLLRHVAERRPAELVAVVDECRSLANDRCPLDAAVGPTGASLIAAERIVSRGNAAPVAAQVSIREPLLRETAMEGRNFFQLFEAVQASLARTDMTIGASSRLSSTFQFHPAGYFKGLGTDCNRVDPAADPATIRSLSIPPILSACQTALDEFPYAEYFRAQLGAAREQLALQRATAGCDPAPAAAYRANYPAGRYRTAVDDAYAACERRQAEGRREEQRKRDQEEDALFRRAVVNCSDRRDAATYGARYPSGRYRDPVNAFLRDCETGDRQREFEARQREQERQDAIRRTEEERRRREAEDQRRRDQEQQMANARVPMSSQAGWTATYASALLQIGPGGPDLVTQDGLITTLLKPTPPYPGKVDVFIQAGENKQCQPANEWADRVLSRNRPQITTKQAVNIAGQRAYFQKGTGFRGDANISFMDVVLIPRNDPNMFVHIGAQYPAADEDRWRDEFFRIVMSYQISPSGVIKGACRQ